MERNNLFNKSQHGFVVGRSCTTQLLEFMEEATQALDRGEDVDVIYLDFAKAFDKGIYLSKALTCMKIFLYEQELLFCQGDGYFWPHCCMNNFCGSFMFLFCLVFAMFCVRLFICALWSPAGKGLTSWLSFVVSSVSLSLSHWYPGSGVVLDCIDS